MNYAEGAGRRHALSAIGVQECGYEPARGRVAHAACAAGRSRGALCGGAGRARTGRCLPFPGSPPKEGPESKQSHSPLSMLRTVLLLSLVVAELSEEGRE